ncbi:MAG: hypothetical protein Q9218_000649 [Villophora microphyllina]
MTEPRARAARHKGQLNFEKELRGLLYAHGDVDDPLPETVRVLDELTTDFVIETCHAASRHATLNNRQKVKLEDFKFVVGKDERLLGRVMELIGMEKELKEARKGFNTDEGKIGLERGAVGKLKRKRVSKGTEKGDDADDADEGDYGDEDLMPEDLPAAASTRTTGRQLRIVKGTAQRQNTSIHHTSIRQEEQ